MNRKTSKVKCDKTSTILKLWGESARQMRAGETQDFGPYSTGRVFRIPELCDQGFPCSGFSRLLIVSIAVLQYNWLEGERHIARPIEELNCRDFDEYDDGASRD